MGELFPLPFGRFQLISRIAVGGMAEVFLAEAPGEHGFAKRMVIKRLLPTLDGDANYQAMFIDEAKLTARLVHPKIAQTFELGKVDEHLFIAMELVDGVDVLAMLREYAQRRRRVEPQIAVWIAHEVLDALDYAHNAAGEDGAPLGVVHRDISPSNILLSLRGDVKLVDFGIARQSDPARSHQTKAGTLKGKYGYMSPEQVVEQPLDQRSDVFSVGVVLAEMLTGRRLFAAANELDVLLMVRDAKLSRLDKYGADINPALQEIVRRGLKKNLDERWHNAAQFRDALGEWLFDQRIRMTPKIIADAVVELRRFIEAKPAAPEPVAVVALEDAIPAPMDSLDSMPVISVSQEAAGAVNSAPPAVARTSTGDVRHTQQTAVRTSGEPLAVARAAPPATPVAERTFAPTVSRTQTNRSDSPVVARTMSKPHVMKAPAPAPAAPPVAMAAPREMAASAVDSAAAQPRQGVELIDGTAAAVVGNSVDAIDLAALDLAISDLGHGSEAALLLLEMPTAAGSGEHAATQRRVPASSSPGPNVPHRSTAELRERFPSIAAAVHSTTPMAPDPAMRDFDDLTIEPGRSIDVRLPSLEELSRKKAPTPPALADIDATPEDSGDFATTPAMRVLFRLMVARATGLLVVAVGGIKKEIYIRDGQPEYVSSNVASELFGNYLVGKGVLSDGELAMALAMVPHYGGKLGDTLVGLGLLKPLEVFRHLTRQVRAKIVDVCTWNKGGFGWYVGRENPREAFPLDFNAFEILGAGAMSMSDDVTDAWFARNGALRFASFRSRRVGPERFEVRGLTEILAMLDGKRSVADIVDMEAGRAERMQVMKMFYLLDACELVRAG
ncbi:MAG: serine/threonine protein kinase [Kofleriaceae bacterium]|nr:serine/threonine protein kinase [Kofleriaceae bacterium]